MEKRSIKVLIADDHDLIRQGLRRILSFEEGIEIVAEAVNGEETLRLLEVYKPDIVLLDCNMPFKNGIEVLQCIKEKNLGTKSIMLTVEDDHKTMQQAIHMGADGYMLKDSAGVEIIQAIKMVYSGKQYVDQSLISLLFLDIRSEGSKADSLLDILSKRELEVLIKISKGLSNKEIGEELYISEKTVKNYATNLFKKMDVSDRVQATIAALKNNVEDYYSMRYNNK